MTFILLFLAICIISIRFLVLPPIPTKIIALVFLLIFYDYSLTSESECSGDFVYMEVEAAFLLLRKQYLDALAKLNVSESVIIGN